MLTAADALLAAAGTSSRSALGPVAVPGAGLTVVIALGRGWRPEREAIGVLGSLREALRNLRPR